MRRIETAIEPTLAGAGELASPSTLTEWGSKYAGAVVRIAGLLHLGEYGEPGAKRPVSVETVRATARIGVYFKATAVNVFARMVDPTISDAVYLLRKVVLLGADELSEREVFTASNRPRFPTVVAMRPALERLVEHGYLIPLERARRPGGGRPPSPRYKVHPSAAIAAETCKWWFG